MQEKILETKICKKCNISFLITDKDLEFYDKISPSFPSPDFKKSGLKKIQIPTPTLCPDCRQQRRFCWRNEKNLYRRKCDLTGKDILSIFSPDKKYVIYNSDDWWSDKWDPLDYGKEYDFTKTFFEQFDSLQKQVPLLNLTAAFNSENSDYATFSGKMKDCYMISGGWTCEKTMYSSRIVYTNNVIDSLDGTNLEQSYQTINCEGCFSCIYCMNSNNCNTSYFLYECENCSDCFMCYNLVGKKYYIDNKSYTKEEYFKQIEDLKQKYFLLGLSVLDEMKKKAINKNLMIIGSEDCIGDNLKNCKNCNYSFHLENSQNCKYAENGGMGCSNVYDAMGIGENFDLGYEILDTGLNAIGTYFGITCYTCNNSFYNINCHNCSNIFGCIGVRNGQYCILNKQYSKEEYDILVPKIIENMRKNDEWGEFFPSSISPFGYNETINTEYFPLRKEEALKLGFNWSTYEAPFTKVQKIIPANKLPKNISDIPDDILNRAIMPENVGNENIRSLQKPFRIVKQELDFYRKYSLPIPKIHPDQRHLDRVKLRNPRKIYDRKCDKCGKDIKTTFKKDRQEIVYCEECYNKEIY
ncbi:MAG: hypothetical protein WC850_01480 [Candidatus Gracilibacteria bacterium]